MIGSLLAAVVLATGCATGKFKIVETIDKDGLRNKTTTGGATTFFDSTSAIANFAAGQGDATNGQRATIGNLNQTSSGSNAVTLVDSVVGAAVGAAIKAAK